MVASQLRGLAVSQVKKSRSALLVATVIRTSCYTLRHWAATLSPGGSLLLPKFVQHPQSAAVRPGRRPTETMVQRTQVASHPGWRTTPKCLGLALILLLAGQILLPLVGSTPLIVMLAAAISSVAGFAFSPLAGAFLFHIVSDKVEAVQIMLVASISLQAYSVWTLRDAINFRELWHYVASGFATLPLGVWLLLNTPLRLHTLSLGLFLCAYAAYMLLRKPTRATVDHTAGRLAVGALGGITRCHSGLPRCFCHYLV